ncbi:RNA-directed DNA polymerase from mobile element jockey [Trichonephila clavipes]|uniref:RNA-directed DNA polymerase from mobile element jockey n=1 Tax=Trichonephila clavipes TaxID=2585209 RepID=A0A8X6V4D5_TRICX|nr:RNA-directed DNA polymerase from mobile element jockey [Trichonephila clavipes]
MFNLRYFPNAWKTAVIIPILKPGKDPKLAESHKPISLLPVLSKLTESHKPISLLPVLSKLTEKIISIRLNDFLENENILVPEQHGFRPRLSTIHQLLHVVEYIKDDDAGILSRHYNLNTLTENINEHLAHLEIWFSVWKIALNTSKPEAVSFSQKNPPPEITLQNQKIPCSQHTKYLGVVIDKNLTFRQHITDIRNNFKNATRKLYSLICRMSKLNRRNKLGSVGALDLDHE